MAKRNDFPVKKDGPLHSKDEGPASPKPVDSNDIYETRAMVSGCDSLNVRREPNKDAAVVGIIRSGTIVEQRATIGEWALIRTIEREKIDGYVIKVYLKEL